MDKKKYEAFTLEILRFDDSDVVTTSGGGGDNLGGWHNGSAGGPFSEDGMRGYGMICWPSNRRDNHEAGF